MSGIEDKERFILENDREIRPLFRTTHQLDEFTRLLSTANYSTILRRFATRIYRLQKPDVNGAKVILTSDNPGPYNAMRGLFSEMVHDDRFTDITAVISGTAAKRFQDDFPYEFQRIKLTSGRLYPTILTLAEKKAFDIAIGSVSVKNGPEVPIMYGGKSNLGAKKLYYIFEAWGGIGSAFQLVPKNMDPVDGIVCNDQLAKAIVEYSLPPFPKDKIHPIGTPILDTIEIEKSEFYRKNGREKLGLSDDTFTVLYLGDVSADYKNFIDIDPNINEVTFNLTLEAFKEYACANPSKKLAFLFRPHPRDHQKDSLIGQLQSISIDGVKLLPTISPTISMSECAYASDVIMSIYSTENFLAPSRGRIGIFLGFNNPGLGGDVLKQSYGDKIMRRMASDPGVKIISSGENLVNVLKEQYAKQNLLPVELPTEKPNYAKKILDLILSETI